MMKTFMTFVACTFCVALLTSTANADHLWVNELHYDNVGGDVGEFIEVGLRTPNGSGAVVSDYAVEFYNGNGGGIYNTTVTLDNATTTSAPISVIDGAATEVVTLFSIDVPTGIQNGAPDGFALVNVTTGSVVGGSFYSYEGTFTAVDGSAVGLTSLALSADEGIAIAPGSSVFATGLGFGADQFNNESFVGGLQTPGAINAGQTFTRTLAVVPEPSSIALLGLVGLAGVIRRRK